MANIEIMKKIELTEEQVRKAFEKTKSDEVKETLTALFPDIAKELTKKKKPTLDDYKTITSYEDACEALNEKCLLNNENNLHIWDGDGNYIMRLPEHIIALMKLETISRALWGKNWQPKPDSEGDKIFYRPWFALWKQDKINAYAYKKKVLLSATLNHGETACFGNMESYYRFTDAVASVGFRLCQETEEKAGYFGGRNFVKLWAEYLRFNFATGDFITND